MKVEVGESLIFSWLRHVQGCPIAQTNWKPSPTWPIRHEASLAADFEKMREVAGQRLEFEVFKRSSFQQFIRQAEIDVLGFRFGEAGPAAVAVDSAFHEAGVQYGDVKETVKRILKKLIRTAFALEAYFDLHEADIVFATPKMHKAVEGALKASWQELQSILAECSSLSAGRMNLGIVANDDFGEEIMQPVLDRMDEVADTSELFLRAAQLARLCEATPRRRQMRQTLAAVWAETEGEPKIGEHVRRTMLQLANTGRLTPEVVADLADRTYCKKTFGLNHPFLRKVISDASSYKQRADERGYNRFWRDPMEIDGARFLLCSQWFSWQRPAFDRWVQEKLSGAFPDCFRQSAVQG